MEIDKERGRSLDAEHGAGLSPPITRPRGKSLTPSVRSSRSDITVVADRSDSDVSFKRSPRRTKTQLHIVEPKVSRWAMFVGVFLGKKWISRKIKCDLRIEEDPENDSDNESIESTNDDYIQMVSVVTSTTEVVGRCLFDTGCAQGNMVSLEFAERLGFTPADFERLSVEERFGGTSATGHTVEPLGILKLTWYHKRSVKVFRGMRFIVTRNTNYEMVIGSASLKKHNLVAPPNFEYTSTDNKSPPDAIKVKLDDDGKGRALRKAEADAHNNLRTFNKRPKPGPTASQQKKDAYEARKAELEENWEKCKRDLETGNKEKTKEDTKKVDAKKVDAKKVDVKKVDAKVDVKKVGAKKESKGQRSGNTLVPQSSPEIDITVSEPNGKTRAPTGHDAVLPKIGVQQRK